VSRYSNDSQQFARLRPSFDAVVNVAALASFGQTLTQGTDSGARFFRVTNLKEKTEMT
jgi:hypothetical protein